MTPPPSGAAKAARTAAASGAILSIGAALVGPVSPAGADVDNLTVTDFGDSGAGTLRDLIAATNDGVVRLTVDHVFSGRGVFVDHGLGFYSMYFHLSEVLVKDGDLVKAGQIIGKVGATGRATGPHLHWGVKLNGARVNPYALLDLPFNTGFGLLPAVPPASDSPSIPDALRIRQ